MHPIPLAAAGTSLRALRVRITDVVWLSVVLLCIGNLGRVPLFTVGVKATPVMLNDVLIIAVVGGGLLTALRNRALMIDRAAACALAFAAVGALSAVLAVPKFGLTPVEFAISIAFLVRWLTYFGVYVAVVNFVGPGDVPRLRRAVEVTILVFAAFGILQSLFLPGFAQIVQPEAGWDVQGRRLVSSFMDPNFAGAFVAAGLLIYLGRMTFGVAVPLWKPLLLTAALIFTISRSAVLAFVAGALVVLLARGLSKRVLRYGLVGTLATLPFLPMIWTFATQFGRFSIEGSASTRLVAWVRAITVFLDNPVLGIGFNTYGFVQDSYGWEAVVGSDFALDGGLLFIAVLTGVVGVTLYGSVIALALHRCRGVYRDRTRTAEDRGLALGIAATTVAIVVHSVFLNSLLFPFLMHLLWVLWGLAFVLRHPAREAEVAEPSGGRSRSGMSTPLPSS
jgi:O-antigen ligase